MGSNSSQEALFEIRELQPQVGSEAWWANRVFTKFHVLSALENRRIEENRKPEGFGEGLDEKLDRLSKQIDATVYKIKARLADMPLGLVMAEKTLAPIDETSAENLSAFRNDLSANPHNTLTKVLKSGDAYGQNATKAGEVRLFITREDSNQAALCRDLTPIAGQTYNYHDITPTHGIVSGRFMSATRNQEVFTYFEVVSSRRQTNFGDRG